ncbi:hypothetical protein INT45_006967 [Circinella minor]|uniref:G-protein coupled receptors family 2 profile 2 domain-containing protein n=1 Tax=Circinella minor TaxID=1195481 RepID=A0A8H7S546_9FUNG|nr:hypothetical protein INT45_006967 [Circinella minor]
METTIQTTPIDDQEIIPDLRFSEPWQTESIHQINIIANTMRIYDYRLVDRVSLRLTAAISLTDMISSSSLLVYNYTSNTGSNCEIAAFLVIWLSNQYIFLSTAIAFNLQWLFLQSHYYNPVFEKWYYIVSVLLSIITAVIPLVGHVLGYDEAQGVCWYTRKNPTTDDQENHTSTPSSSQKIVCNVVRRILLYPTTPFLTQFGFIISEIYMFSTLKVSYELNIWGVLTKALPGFFNLVGFLMDPAFMGALRLLKSDLIRRYGDTPSDLHRSNSHQSFDKRSCKIYADHGALDFVMPRNTTCASLAPLAKDQQQQDSQKTSNNRFMRWFVNRVFKPSSSTTNINNSIPIPSSIPNSSSGHIPSSSSTEMHNNNNNNIITSSSEKTGNTPFSSSDELPTFLNSPTVYLIGEDTPYQRQDIIKDYPSINSLHQQQEETDNNEYFTIPVFFKDQLDEAVPWRVLEASFDEQEEQPNNNNDNNQQQDPYQQCSLGSHSNTGMDSWLELSEPVSPSKMSQWLTKRGDSFEIVRERVVRSSKSIRRWCKHQQQFYQDDQHEKMDDIIHATTTPPDNDSYITTITTSSSAVATTGTTRQRDSRTLSGCHFDYYNNTFLQSVPESHLESYEQQQELSRGI